MFCDFNMSEVVLKSERRELNHLSTFRKRNQCRDTLSSGERTGFSLNLEIVNRQVLILGGHETVIFISAEIKSMSD